MDPGVTTFSLKMRTSRLPRSRFQSPVATRNRSPAITCSLIGSDDVDGVVVPVRPNMVIDDTSLRTTLLLIVTSIVLIAPGNGVLWPIFAITNLGV